MAKIFSAPSVTVSKLSAANILTTSGGDAPTGQLGTMTQTSLSWDGNGGNAAPIRSGF